MKKRGTAFLGRPADGLGSPSHDPRRLKRVVDAHPFVPSHQESLRERCQDIFHAQVAGLTRRLEHLGKPGITLGVSGGLDSTLALLVACKTLDLLACRARRLKAMTMPGFGTSGRTLANAQALMRHLGVTAREIDIRSLCLGEMLALGHRPFRHHSYRSERRHLDESAS